MPSYPSHPFSVNHVIHMAQPFGRYWLMPVVLIAELESLYWTAFFKNLSGQKHYADLITTILHESAG